MFTSVSSSVANSNDLERAGDMGDMGDRWERLGDVF